MKGLTLLVVVNTLVCLAQANEDLIGLYDLQLNRCKGKDGVFLPIPGRCSQYLICVEGIGIVSTCGAYHFDARRSVCDVPSRAGCISLGPEPNHPVEDECSGKSDGTKLPIPSNSSKFYLCVQGKSYVQDCGALRFDAQAQKCIHFARDPQKSTKKLPQGPCDMATDGVKLPVPGNTKQYYFCLNRKAFLKDCGDMFFSSKYSACVLTPDEKAHADEVAVIPAQDVPGRHDALGQKVCRNQKIGGRVAVPGTCSEYYVCMGNIGIPKSCGEMQFSPISKSCDLSSNVRCKVQTTGVIYEPPERPAEPINPTAINVCRGQRDGMFVAAPGKCSDFYFCMKNRGFLKTCGHRHFSPITLSCVEVDESNCVDAITTIPVVPFEDVSSINVCLQRDNGILLKHPADCGKFLICDNQNPVAMDCPGGLQFNAQRGYCDWPAEANCI